jgi:hypothetical protein
MLSSIVLSGEKISQEKTTVYSVTMKQAIINVLIDAAVPVTLIPVLYPAL